jgi:radical SAM family uncharacterized protein/radical SAM-linked protein
MAKSMIPIDRKRLERVLRIVEKPGRYVGGEWNQVRKDPRKVKSKVALVFPDAYEIGMSYLGQKILYHILNARPDVLAERVFAPWPDFERGLREAGLPLYSLENRIPLHEFDIVGVSLLYELDYSNVLTVLDLGGIPVLSSERNNNAPFVIAGGPAAFNPEPVADVFDLFLLGDGEEAFPEIVEKVMSLKKAGADRRTTLRELSEVKGVYVPSLYEPEKTDRSPLVVPRPIGGAPTRIEKRILKTFANSEFPDRIVVPGVRAVFDRVAIEAARGCPQNCRFCQATNLYFPFRVKSPDKIIRTMGRSLYRTGYEDASLTALSISDYPYLEETVRVLMGDLEDRKVSLSLSSLRPKGLSPEIVENIVKVRKTGFTLVPEAGTERLRRVINKKLDDREIRDALTFAFSRGWKLVKLYFMVGLPTETDEDLAGIVALVRDIIALGEKILGAAPRINLSVSSFIPKPHTPFQWLAMDEGESLSEKQEYLRSELRRSRSVEFKKHPVDTSLLEAAFSRGDRRLSGVLKAAWDKGARFESWGDHLNIDFWQEAFDQQSVPPEDYWKGIDTEAVLPWDHIDTGIKKSHLLKELGLALEELESPSCYETTCAECRACDFPEFKIKSHDEKISIKPVGAPRIGKRSDAAERYLVLFSKRGPARFLSHIDLIHVLQRAFRRAGVTVLQSQGFHPKMIVSYGPALALGMEGGEEPLEFRSAFIFDEKEFVGRMNRSLPEGIHVLKLSRLDAAAPSLNRNLTGIVYSLNLKDPGVEPALREADEGHREGKKPSGAKTTKALISAYEPKKPEGVALALEWTRRKLFITVPILPGKSPRPQDIVEEMLGINNSVYALTRERFIYLN